MQRQGTATLRDERFSPTPGLFQPFQPARVGHPTTPTDRRRTARSDAPHPASRSTLSASPHEYVRTDELGIVVPREMAGPLATLIHEALPKLAADYGCPLRWTAEFKALQAALVAAARSAPRPMAKIQPQVTLTVVEAAEAIGVDPRTIRRMASRGLIPGVVETAQGRMIPERWVLDEIERRDTPSRSAPRTPVDRAGSDERTPSGTNPAERHPRR